MNAAWFTWIIQFFALRIGAPYVYGGVWSPTDPGQGCDCSGAVGTILECITNGPENMSWAHVINTESWPYDYNSGNPAAVGTVGPYNTIAIASPGDAPSDAALVICIAHYGGGANSHMACNFRGMIMESNGTVGTCSNFDGGTEIDSNYWTDFWYLPGPVDGHVYYYADPEDVAALAVQFLA